MIYLIAVLAISALAIMFVLVFKHKLFGSKTQPAGPIEKFTLPNEFPYFKLTPNGTHVSSVVDIPDTALEAIDRGIGTQLEKISAVHPDWTNHNKASDYIVFFVPPMATNKENDPGSPAIIVNGEQASGTCIVIDGIDYVIIVPHQEDQFWRYPDYLMRTAWNESEHVRLFYNNKTLFQYFTGVNDVHPFFP